jgi:uncharacterized protein YgiM (DUF1202 family)
MKKYAAILTLLLAALPAWATSGKVVRNTDIRQKPFLDAPVVAPVRSGTAVTLQNRQGAWLQVKTADGKTGWIKLLNVQTEGGVSTGQGISQTTAALSSLYKTGSSGTTVTTGVKGLSKEQITQAKPNPAEVEKMKQYAVSAQEAERAAQAQKLSRQQVAAIEIR